MNKATISKIALVAVLAIAAVVLLLFALQRYDEDKLRQLEPAVAENPNWPPWMNALAEKLAEDPAYHAAKNPDFGDMIFIPEGKALVGCKEKCRKGIDIPMHEVQLQSFYIDKTPVTLGKYMECVNKRLCLPPVSTSFTTTDQNPANPVIVDFDRASRYCTWLGKRLPIEDEWEKAARGTDGRSFPWGDDPPSERSANFCDVNCAMKWANKDFNDGYVYISPVGSFPEGASPYGLLDVAGNVKEWVIGKPLNPDTEHIAKGSSWYSTVDQMATHIRQEWKGGIRLDDKSVRCAADAAR